MSDMQEAAHTPGPWHFYTEPQPNGCPIVGAPSGVMVAMLAHTINQAEQKEEALANARLIASAPELLSMVHRLEVAANTVQGCLDRRPENFAMAMRELEDLAAEARELQAKVAA